MGSPHWSRGIAVTGLVFLLTCDGDGAACFRGTQEDPDFSCRFVLLVSGLGLGGGGGESLLGTQLLVDVVTGQLGDEGEQCSAAHVSRVILAGNLLSHSTQSRDCIKAKYLTEKTLTASVQGVEMLGKILLLLRALVPME